MRTAVLIRSMASAWTSRAKKALRSSSCCSCFFLVYRSSSSIFFISASEAICFRSCGRKSVDFDIAFPLSRKKLASCVLCASGGVRHGPHCFGLALVASALSSGMSRNDGLEDPLDLAHALLRRSTVGTYDVDEFPQIAAQSRCELGFPIEHRRNCVDRPALVQQQHEELIADQLLEVGQRHALACLLTHAAQEIEAALIGDALGAANVKQRSYHGLARAAPGHAFPELAYASSNPS